MTSETSSEVLGSAVGGENGRKKVKLHGRAFYESIGSPKLVLAPMVEQSEFAWRMLTRSFIPPSEQSNLLCYTPMFHSKMFAEKPKYRESHFQPVKGPLPSPPTSQLPDEAWYLDGNPELDRPLTVQFCSNNPDDFLQAAKHVAPFCDAVDLNLGCPQGIARRGNYGAFLQEDWTLISSMIKKLHQELDIPVTAKMRCLETKEKTLEYAKMILDAGASIITVHGRRREQKGHNTGLADWNILRYLRENLPKETVIFANGNILQHGDIEQCLAETGADGVMSAEGNLHDPAIFAVAPPVGQEGREYWRGKDGKGGYRMDAVMRRYLDIIHKHALGSPPPERKPLFIPGDPEQFDDDTTDGTEEDGPPAKRAKLSKTERKHQKAANPNLSAMQAHLFHLLRPLVAEHHDIRDALAKSRVGMMESYEKVLSMVEKAVKEGLIAYEKEHGEANGDSLITKEEPPQPEASEIVEADDPHLSSLAAVARCKRPWWVCQPYVRPVPKEALEKGSMQLSKKDRKKLEEEATEVKAVGLEPGGRLEKENLPAVNGIEDGPPTVEEVEIPKEGVVCG